MIKKITLLFLVILAVGGGLQAKKEKEVITRGEYTLIFVNQDPHLEKEVKEGLIQTFFKVYPKMVKDFNPEAAREVKVTIDTAYNGVAYAHEGKITIASKWMEKNPGDLDVITHEGMHLVQAYPGGAGPDWLTEGIADYVRYVYGVDNQGAGWSLPEFDPGHSYTNSYRITARFLFWINQNYDKRFVKKMDHHIRNKTYSDELWSGYTGKSLEELWDHYSVDPEVEM